MADDDTIMLSITNLYRWHMKNELNNKKTKLLDRKIELETELSKLSKKFNKEYTIVSKHLAMVKKELERI